MFVLLAKYMKRFPSAVVQPGTVHAVTSNLAVNPEVSSNLNVTDLCFCCVVNLVGSAGLSLKVPFCVDVKVLGSVVMDTSVSSSRVNAEKP